MLIPIVLSSDDDVFAFYSFCPHNFLFHDETNTTKIIDGIYVLLRPNSNKNLKKYGPPAIPSHVAHFKIEEMPLEQCQWSLSGPQFPTPTAIQQRYCYPKGNPAYASEKGGALWTMYDRDAKEDDEFRLLHVYFSEKRAANKSITNKASAPIFPKNSNSKKTKRKAVTVDGDLARSAGKCSKKPKRHRSKIKSNFSHIRTTTGVLLPASPLKIKNPIDELSLANVSPNTISTTSVGIKRNESDDGSFGDHLFHPVPSFMANEISELGHGTFVSSLESSLNRSQGNIFRRSHLPGTCNEATKKNRLSLDQLNPTLDLDVLTGLHFSDPSFMIKNPVTETLALPNVQQRTILRPQQNGSYAESLARNLNTLHEMIIREWILSRPYSEQGKLLSIVANWASSLFRSPLELSEGSATLKDQRDEAAYDKETKALKKMEEEDDTDTAVAV